MNTLFMLGKSHRLLGYSQHYNPFRHKGSADDYIQWYLGWMGESK